MNDLVIVFGRANGELDAEIAALYLRGWEREEIAVKVGLADSSVARRLGKMFRAGEICPRGGRFGRGKNI
jgi:hypothetical protein